MLKMLYIIWTENGFVGVRLKSSSHRGIGRVSTLSPTCTMCCFLDFRFFLKSFLIKNLKLIGQLCGCMTGNEFIELDSERLSRLNECQFLSTFVCVNSWNCMIVCNCILVLHVLCRPTLEFQILLCINSSIQVVNVLLSKLIVRKH